MKYRRLSEDGDMLPVTSVYTLVYGAQAVGCAIRSRLLSFRGEWWELPDEGIDPQYLFGKISDERERVAKALIINLVSQTKHVKSVNSIQFVNNALTKSRAINLEVETDFGTVTVEV